MQLYSEFHRITNQNLPYSFYAALDKYTPQLLKLYKKRKTGSFGEKMEDVLRAYEEQVKTLMHYIDVECEQNCSPQHAYLVFVCATGQEQHHCSSNSSPGWPTAVLKGGFIRGLQNLQGIFVFSFFCFHSLIPSSILQREITEHKNLKPPSTALCTLGCL